MKRVEVKGEVDTSVVATTGAGASEVRNSDSGSVITNLVVDNGKIVVIDGSGNSKNAGLSLSCKESAGACTIRNTNLLGCTLDNFVCGSYVNVVSVANSVVLPEQQVKNVDPSIVDFFEGCTLESVTGTEPTFNCNTIKNSYPQASSSCPVEVLTAQENIKEVSDKITTASSNLENSLTKVDSAVSIIQDNHCDVPGGVLSIDSIKTIASTCDLSTEDTAALGEIDKITKELQQSTEDLKKLTQEFSAVQSDLFGDDYFSSAEDIANFNKADYEKWLNDPNRKKGLVECNFDSLNKMLEEDFTNQQKSLQESRKILDDFNDKYSLESIISQTDTLLNSQTNSVTK
jgi:hypothetical protein